MAIINGTANNDVLTVQTDTTSVQAGAGTDIVVFSGNYTDYTFGQSDSYVPLMTNNTTNQVVSLHGVEQLQFDDVTAVLNITGSGEFQVNTHTDNSQSNPSITALNNGGFVVTWASDVQDGFGWGIFAQMYDANGTTQGSEFQVNTHTISYQNSPSISTLIDGGFVITWESYGQDGSLGGIYAQIYNSDGTAQSNEFQVNTYTAQYQFNQEIATINNGSFVVVWQSEGDQDGLGNGIFGQMHDANGNTIGSEFLVNTHTSGDEVRPSIAALNNGGFVITWSSSHQDNGIFAQIYNADGTTQGGEFQINTYETSSYQNITAITTLADGRFVVSTLVSSDSSGLFWDCFAQIYNADGTTQGNEFQVNEMWVAQNISITALTNGDFVIVYDSILNWQEFNCYAVIYSANGIPQGAQFQVNTYTTGDQIYPSITALNNGGFVVTWHGEGAEDGSGIYAQQYDAEGNPLGLTTLDSNETFTLDSSINTIDGGYGNDTLTIGHTFVDYAVGISPDGTVIIRDANGNSTTITDVENFNFSDQSFDMAGLLSDADVRPLFASPEYVGGEWVNSYIIPDVFYSGNAGLDALYDYQFFGDGTGNILVASDDNDFINGFGGDDAINTGAGNDIIDGGLGSNFLTGGTGNDTFFSDGREAGNGAITWSTVTDFTDGTNSVNIWGYIDGTSSYMWFENAGAIGYTGATLHADLDGNGVIDTSMTFTGMNISEMNAPQGLEVGGTGYLLIG